MARRERLSVLRAEIAACTLCASSLPLGPRPVVQFSRRSRVVLIGQAPGTKVHASGVPWDDASGDNLREWLQVTPSEFYDPDRFALVPMGFCYPGKKPGGDAPPRPECAPAWHQRILDQLPADALIVLLGQYAQRHYLGRAAKRTLTETVRAFPDYLPRFMPLPHPSWRSRLWMQKHPWFEAELLPALRQTTTTPCGGTAPTTRS
ncbi:uracil-DNA glycosylase family protein [Enhygromyxa salina]|uniref:Uracil DNA glycosylase superfamily protein n=1 Tax=Enhygromyxa salina TaxID=215803 RepID=A0A2S9YY27_9BACT|nr:uracil-DNA glycosylase family protein [Enhygromyxa salina]PRQ09990.1 Uracil DNA glycosylase superfamily protein [Enhygromyxa salina]